MSVTPVAPELAPVGAPPGDGRLISRIWRDPNGRIGLLLTALLLVAGACGALNFLPHDPVDQFPDFRNQPPSGMYWFGSDQFGRDIFARVAAGIWTSLRVSVVAVGLATVVGSVLGVCAGFFGGWLDQIISRFVEVLFAFPAILLALAVVSALGSGWQNTAIAIAIVYTPIFARVARGPTLGVAKAEFIKAQRVLGIPTGRILLRHVLPNVSAPIVVQVTLALSWALLTESALSFLGLGTQPPDPSLGLMVADAQNTISSAWWTMAFPAGTIVVAVIALNLLGDGLRSALDPPAGLPMTGPTVPTRITVPTEPTAPAGPVLSVRDLHTTVRSRSGAVPILRGVSFDVSAGETLALVGESGSGKSFTALSIAGLLPAGATATGQVLLDGSDILPLPESRRRTLRGASIGMVYQDPMTALNPVMRIGGQVAEGLRAHGWSATAAQARTLEVLDEVGLPSPKALARLYPHQLSGGMRQRVLIAGAVALRPKVLIADEPTTALDVTIQQQIVEVVAALRDEYGLAVVWITHDLGVVARIADSVAVMYAGRVVERARTADLFDEPHHPYTDGLLRSIPSRDHLHQAPLPQIGGTPVSLSALPDGCPFAPRCPQVADRCRTEEPPLLDRGHGQAACWIPPENWSAPEHQALIHA